MPTTSLDYEFSACTDVGRVRRNNEDAIAVHEDVCLAIVADGMGGSNAGEVASAMAVDIVGRELRRWLLEAGERAHANAIRAALVDAVDQANQAILDAGRTHAAYAGMGTTLVVGVFWRAQFILGHVGDSRGYLLRSGVLRQITRDHTWLQEQLDHGFISPREAADSGMRNLLTRALGVDPQVQVEINEFAVRPGDLYLLCTDGLTDRLDATALAALLRTPASLHDIAGRLIARANELGGRDNTSVLLAHACPAE